jgi:hypothetical protein
VSKLIDRKFEYMEYKLKKFYNLYRPELWL